MYERVARGATEFSSVGWFEGSWQTEGVRPRFGIRRPAVAEAPLDGRDPDALLMLRVRDGSEAAFHELFRRHREGLINFAYRFVGTSARAEELVQDAFLQIYRARSRYEPRARFVTYIYRVLTNLCLNERRRFAYHGRVESFHERLANDPGAPPMDVADPTIPAAEDQVAGRETAARIEAVLERLPRNQRVALLLSRMDGLSYGEVAEVLGSSVSAVKSLIFRATQTLKESLSDLV